MSDEDFDDMPIQWNTPHEASQEVTEQQLHEFEKAFLLIQSKYNDALNQQKQIKTQYKKLKTDKTDLIREKKQVETEIQNFIEETENIKANLNNNQVPKPKNNSKDDLNTQQEMMEISTINSNINELKNKFNKLQTQYSEEVRLWKVEKTRLTNILQEQQNESDIMKKSIEQFQAYLNEDEKPEIIEEEEESDSIQEEKEEKRSANHSKLSISDVSSAESPIRKSRKFSPTSSSTDSDSEKSEKFENFEQKNKKKNFNDEPERSKEKYEVINNSLNVVANPNSNLVQALSNSPAKQFNLITTPMQMIEEQNYEQKLKFQQEQQQNFEQKLKFQQEQQKNFAFDEKIQTDFMPAKYKLDFTYRPNGNPKKTNTLKNGREFIYENGDKFIEYKNGVKKITRRDGTKYVIFKNGDISKEFSDGAVAYFFDETRAIQLTLTDQNVHTVFSNGQREINFANGDKYVIYPDNSTKYTKLNGDYQIRFQNGRTQNCINGVVFTS